MMLINNLREFKKKKFQQEWIISVAKLRSFNNINQYQDLTISIQNLEIIISAYIKLSIPLSIMSASVMSSPAEFTFCRTPRKVQSQIYETIDSLLKFSSFEINFSKPVLGSIKAGQVDFRLKKRLKKPLALQVQIIPSSSEQSEGNQIFGLQNEKKMSQSRIVTLNPEISKSQILRLKVFARSPKNINSEVKAILKISNSDNPEDKVEIKINMDCTIPTITCPRELQCKDYRAIKLGVVQDKSENVSKIPFTLNHSASLSLQLQLLGLEDKISPIRLKRTKLQVNEKSGFFIELQTNITQDIRNKIKPLKQNDPRRLHQVRKILIIKIQGTEMLYHFPIIVSYYGPGI